MNRQLVVAVVMMIAVMMSPVALGAYGGHVHKALGTIAGVQNGHVEIKTTDGKALTVMLDKKTTVMRGAEKLDATALKVGERISVDYMEMNKMMMAQTIKLAVVAAARK